MESSNKEDKIEALDIISAMIERSKKAQRKFSQGTSQYTLQKNRINALYIVSSLIQKELKRKRQNEGGEIAIGSVL